jgi:hypothetical protein
MRGTAESPSRFFWRPVEIACGRWSIRIRSGRKSKTVREATDVWKTGLRQRAKRATWRRLRVAVSLAIAAGFVTGGPPMARAQVHGVAAGMLNVEQISEVDSNIALVTLALSINQFHLGTFNRADYDVRIGTWAEAASNVALGVLMTSVTENGRDNFGTNGYPASAFAATDGGGYRIVSYLSPGIEYNVNVAGAWFPYDRYLGGYAHNAADLNGGTNDAFTGSPGLLLGTHFKGVAAGKSVVDLRSFGIDSRTDGVLLVNHAKDEDNFALSQVNTDDGTWNVFVRDIGEGTYADYEQDPVAFVFIPKTNTALISGRFKADGSIEMFSGGTPQFTVTNVGTGTWDLRIIGHSPTNGVLIISPEGGGSSNGDNIASYQAYTNGAGWEIQSRDTPANGLQTPTGDPVVSFVFVPAPPPGFVVTPTNGLVTTGSGGTATFSVALQAPPAAVVTLDVTSSAAAKGIAAPGMLTFDANDWFVPHTVTVTGQTGASEGSYNIVLSPASSADPGYQGLDPEDISVSSLAARASVIGPTNNAVQITPSPTLRVAVTNTTAGNLMVTFYGRVAPTVFPGPDFCIAVMPDTQMYTAEKSGGTKEMMIAQTEWSISNRLSRNVAYVTQLGDISNNGDTPSYISQWYNATNAMYRLENPARTELADGMAYGVAVGNHEQSPNGWATFGTTNVGTTSNYNKYFGVSHFSGREYYAGHYSTNNNNHFDFFSAGGLDFVVLYFEFNTNPPPELLAWANQVLATNAWRRAIVVTHNMGNTTTPLTFSDQGAILYNALKGNTNLFLMLGGHVTGQGARQDTYQGRIVRTFVQDYQGWTNGGYGFMRTYDFSPSNNVVVIETFSPVTGEILTDEYSELYFPYDLQPTGPGTATPFVALATNLAVAPGDVSSCWWPGLQPNKAYEWYVAVTDQSGVTVASPVWRFTTATSNTAPSVVNLARTLTGDAPTNFVLLASDANSDALTFQTHTSPTHGLLRDFNPVTGAFTYWPAYGYRGTDRFTFSANDGQANSPVATMNFIIVSPPDANANGLPDGWEAAYGLGDPDGDADGDGQSNLEECLSNTNPTNAASVLQITDWLRLTNGHVSLAWSSIGGTRYRVQFRNGTESTGVLGAFTDLVRPLTNEMDPNPYGAASAQSFTDDFTLTGGSPTNHSRYYRIRVER